MLSSPADFEVVFAALPGRVLLLLPDAPTYTIAGISDDLLAWLGLSRAAVLGQGLAALGAGAAGARRAGWLAAVRASVGAALGVEAGMGAAGSGTGAAPVPAVGHTRPVPGPDGTVRYLLHTTAVAPAAPAPTASHYHTLLEGLHAGTALYLGPDHIIAYANPLILRYWGKDARVLGLPLLDALPEVVGQPFPALLAQVYATGQPYVGTRQAAALRVAGELRTAYFDFTYQPLRDAAGQVYGIHNTAIDVTAEVLASQQLVESERRFRALVEQAPVAITLTRGPEVVVESVNAPMLRVMGKASAAEVLGRPVQELLPHLALEEVLAIVKNVTATGQPYYGSEVPVPMPDATGVIGQRYFNLSYTPLLEAGMPQGVIQVAVDVTEQVRARQQLEASQAALRESEERFRSMADAAPTPMWAVNPVAGTRYVNRAFLEFLGLTLPEYLATNWTAYLHPDDAEAGRALMSLPIEQRAHHAQEYRVRRHDGQYRWLLTQGAPNYHASGVLHGYVGAAIDVTDLKEANERLARTNADLDNFIYTASHDLKAPITNIEGLLTMLERALPPAARVGHTDKVLTLMHHSVERFRRTLRELTAVVSLQQDYAEAPALVSLPAVLDEVCLDLAPQLREARAHVVRELLDCVHIRFSAKNLRSVVYNLFSNALKYRAPGRPALVELACHATPLHHVLTVRDNGLGFEPARAGQLFELFGRLHGHVEGSGVGLYLVRRMLENAGGRIEATGEVGVGATFTVYFPR
ncbi:MAG TPA: PAS domain S-box protein [Hymenobacter sp.]|uniref:PAS domain-containing sensor histidine kinase n=1 Tax=Hymenobacter sp. TaxID=1898978 RepID=UPI002D80B638|nr:PAS domain S-box protein [Hymenobacter sp.]HET9502747.1 PAS domain S-box protein [Hymenobacter sp.]